MRTTLLAVIAALAGLTAAQNDAGLAPCAKDCVTKFTTGSQIGGCASLDIACICSSPSFLSGIACCLAGACDQADQQAAVVYAQNICKTADVTNLPAAVACSSSSGAAALTSTPSTSAGDSTSSASNAGTGQSTTSSAGSGSTSTAAPLATNKTSAATTGTAAGGSQTSSSSTTSPTKNASPQNVAGVGAGVLGGLAAVVAML